jgi:hypothetical protein
MLWAVTRSRMISDCNRMCVYVCVFGVQVVSDRVLYTRIYRYPIAQPHRGLLRCRASCTLPSVAKHETACRTSPSSFSLSLLLAAERDE